MKTPLRNKGIILAETLMAISLCVTVAIVAGYLMSDAISTTILSRNFLIAKNLALEGVEVVENIRNTNWLRNPDNKDCWLSKNSDNCPNKVTAGNYIIFKSNNGNWILSNNGITIDLNLENYSAGMEAYRLYLKKIGNFEDSPKGYFYGSGEASPFYRSVKFTSVGGATFGDDIARFEVKLQWKEGAKVRTIVRKDVVLNSLE